MQILSITLKFLVKYKEFVCYIGGSSGIEKKQCNTSQNTAWCYYWWDCFSKVRCICRCSPLPRSSWSNTTNLFVTCVAAVRLRRSNVIHLRTQLDVIIDMIVFQELDVYADAFHYQEVPGLIQRVCLLHWWQQWDWEEAMYYIWEHSLLLLLMIGFQELDVHADTLNYLQVPGQIQQICLLRSWQRWDCRLEMNYIWKCSPRVKTCL